MEVVLVIHLIVALAIIAIVLVQPSEAGGFLGSSGSMSNLMAPRRTADVLTRATTILAGTFFLTSLLLAILAEHRGPAKSILDELPAQPSSATKVVPSTEPSPDDAALKSVPVAPAAEKTDAPKKGKPVAPISK